MQRDLPSGTVTFLFTDVEGSTRLLHDLGAEGYAEVLAEHRSVIRDACPTHGGVEVDTQGDAFFFAFPTAPGALAAAGEMTEALASGRVQVRIGLHTGTPLVTEEGYVGGDVHRAARIAAAGHGGQVLVSSSAAAAITPSNSLLQGALLTDLGEHRFKDLAEPEWLFQLGDEVFPPLRSIGVTNLPTPASTFVGRERELREIVSLVTDGARLVTLTGPGGTGKTRLALEAAWTVAPEYPNGTFWIPIASLRDPELVLETVSQVLGAKDGLESHIGGRAMLLLLDNFEQVVDAAPALGTLLEACPKLSLLVTSRETLRVSGEREYQVPELSDEEGVSLFCERSQLPASETIAELCRRLDDMPLALELAAARTALFSPRQLLERISQRLDLLKAGRDADPRQQTLRATIEWSHDLLSDDEQQLFRRLSVFAGCTYEAAEEVAGADSDTLQSLLEKNLVRRRDGDDAPRFWMLETIREYAAERLEQSDDEETIRERHLDHFLALSERAYQERLASGSTWLPIVGGEHDNIRAALDWAAISRPQAEAQLAGAIASYWQLGGRVAEARERLAAVLGRYESRDRIRARVLTHLGGLDFIDEDKALSYLDEALNVWRELGDAAGEALALEALGWTHDQFGQHEAARIAFEQSLAVRRQAGAPELDAWQSLAGLCHALVASGEIERAEPAARELQGLGARYDARRAEQLGLHFLADCPLVGGDYPEAEHRYLRALAYARTSGLPRRCVDELLGVAMSAAGRGDCARAVRLAAAAYAEKDVLEMESDHWWSKMQEWFIEGARALLSSDELEAAERAGREMPFDAVLDEVLGTETASAA